MMAERLRPNLVNTMKAVFRTNRISNNIQSDLTPFINTMKRIGEVMFATLFTVCILPSNLFRVWDTIFIYGFEAAHKVALAILSKNERLLQNTIKTETKSLGIGNTVDALIISGNHAKAKLLTKVEKLPIEKMLKKAISKSKYQAITREDFIDDARRIEQDYITRIQKLKQTKATMIREHTEISKEDLTSLFRELMNSNKDGLISRVRFTDLVTIKFRWEKWLAASVFSSYDHSGNDSIGLKELLAGLCIIHTGSIEDKLSLLFIAYDTDNSGYLDPDEIIDLICSLENSMDGRSSFFKSQSQSMYKRMDRNEDGKISLEEFIKAAKEEMACRPIIEFLEAINNPGDLQYSNLKFINQYEPSYIDGHSPIKQSPLISGVSESSIDGLDLEDVYSGSRIREIAIEHLLRDDFNTSRRKFTVQEVKPVDKRNEDSTENISTAPQIKSEDMESEITDIQEHQYPDLMAIPDTEEPLEPLEPLERPVTPTEIREIFEYDSIRVEDFKTLDPNLPEYFSRDISFPSKPSSHEGSSERGSFEAESEPKITIFGASKSPTEQSKASSSYTSPKNLMTVDVDIKRRPSSTSEIEGETDQDYDLDGEEDMYEYTQNQKNNLQTIPADESPAKKARRCDRVCAQVDCCIV